MRICHFNTTDIESALSKLELTFLIELKRAAKNIKKISSQIKKLDLYPKRMEIIQNV